MDDNKKDKLNNNNNSNDLFKTLLNKGGVSFSQSNNNKPSASTPKGVSTSASGTSSYNKPKASGSTHKSNQNDYSIFGKQGSGKSAPSRPTPSIFGNMQRPQPKPSSANKTGAGNKGGVNFEKGGYSGASKFGLSAEERKSLLNTLNTDFKATKNIKTQQQAKASQASNLFNTNLNKYGKKNVTIDSIFNSSKAFSGNKPSQSVEKEQPSKQLPKSKIPSIFDFSAIERPASQTQSKQNMASAPRPKPMASGDLIAQLQALKNKDKQAQLDKDLNLDSKDQSIVEQLRRLQNKQDEDDVEKKKKRKGFFWILFIILLIGITIGTGVLVFFSREWGNSGYEYVRISVNMDNAFDEFFDIDETGEAIPRLINPGDSFNLRIVARNSNDIEGDEGAENWYPVYLRFSVWLEIDGVKYPNFVQISPNEEDFMTFDPLVEQNYYNYNNEQVVSVDDGYYYYTDKLDPNNELVLIESITFNPEDITEMIGGMVADLVVEVDVLDEFSAILNRDPWIYAPEEWVRYMNDNIVLESG